MIFGNLIGQASYIYRLRKFIPKKSFFFLNKKEHKQFFKENKKHIIIQTLNQLIELSLTLSFSLILVNDSSFSELGYFSIFLRVLYAPGMLVSDYLSHLALSRITEFNNKHDKILFLSKLIALLSIGSILISFIFSFFGKEIFTIIFGEKWIRSGEISRYYIWGICATFFIRSLQYITNSMKRHEVYTFFSLITYGTPPFYLYYYQNFGLTFFQALSHISIILIITAFTYTGTLIRLLNRDQSSTEHLNLS